MPYMRMIHFHKSQSIIRKNYVGSISKFIQNQIPFSYHTHLIPRHQHLVSKLKMKKEKYPKWSALAPISIAQPLGFFRNSGSHNSCSTFSNGFFLFYKVNKPTFLKKHRRPYVVWVTLLLCLHHLPFPHHNSCNLLTQWSSWYYLNLSSTEFYFKVFTFASFCLCAWLFVCLEYLFFYYASLFLQVSTQMPSQPLGTTQHISPIH